MKVERLQIAFLLNSVTTTTAEPTTKSSTTAVGMYNLHASLLIVLEPEGLVEEERGGRKPQKINQ